MLTTWIAPRLKKLFRPRRPGARPRHQAIFQPRLEALEDRTVPSTATWDGGSPTNGNWSDPRNWVGDVAPLGGEDLVFPAGAARVRNFNNFASGTSFHSLTFSAAYVVSGTSFNVLNLGAGGITYSDPNPNSLTTYAGPIQLDGQRPINVSSSSLTLILDGAISGSGGIMKTGLGTLSLGGPDANTYTGLTDLRGGRLIVGKVDFTAGTTRIAIPGNLQVTSTDVSATEVLFGRNSQIADNATVTLLTPTTNKGKSLSPLLNLHGFFDTIGSLNLTGGVVDSGTGDLLVNGDVTAQAARTGIALNGTESFSAAQIFGNFSLGGPTRTITVNKQSGTGLGLEVNASTFGGTLIKEGAGLLVLEGDASVSGVEVNAGTLEVNGLLSGSVILRNDAVLTGSGEVSGAIRTEGGAVQTLDNGSRGFTTTTGWSTVAVHGAFGSDVTATSASSTGTGRTATWTFTGLTPGVYRVFASWTSGLDHTPKALYNISDNTRVLSTPIIDQEVAPAGGPKDGGVVFQQLGGPVNITSNTLNVELSTKFGGGVFIADAVRIERMAGTLSPEGELRQSAGSVTLGSGSTYRVNLFSDGAISSADFLEMRPDTFVNNGALLVLSSPSFVAPTPGTSFIILSHGTFTGTFSNAPNSGDTIELAASGQRHTFTINYHNGFVELIYQNTATQVRDLKVSPDVIKAGNRVTLHGALTDPNPGDVLSLRVDWGDGTAVQTFTNLGTKPFHFSHAYATASPAGSPYQVRVEWFDQKGAGNFQKLSVTVNDLAAQLFSSTAGVAGGGTMIQTKGNTL